MLKKLPLGKKGNKFINKPIEIIINGQDVNEDYLNNIKPKIKKKIGREVSFLINQKLDLNSIILYKKNN